MWRKQKRVCCSATTNQPAPERSLHTTDACGISGTCTCNGIKSLKLTKLSPGYWNWYEIWKLHSVTYESLQELVKIFRMNCQNGWKDSIKNVLTFQQMQSMEENRINKIKSMVRQVADIERSVIPIINTCIDGMVKASDGISAEEVTLLSTLLFYG